MHRITLLALAAGAVGISACGSSSGGGPTSDSSEQRALQFARCMRSHGVDIPDPKAGQGGNLQFHIGGPGANGPTPTQMQSAQTACNKYAPNGGRAPSPAQQQEMRDQALKFSRCMRAHGVDMPDPQTGPGGTSIIKRGSGPSINPSSPAFQSAQKACQGVLPKGASLHTSGGGGAAAGATSSAP